jgi:hypothetical protein
MAYIGDTPQLQGAYDKADDISSQFDGTATTFDIKVNGVDRLVGKETNLVVGIDHQIQEPITDYTVSGSTITFITAPASGAKCFITILGDVFKAPTTGNTDLNSLTDVTVGSPNDDEVLAYSAGTWINKPAGTSFLSSNNDVDTTNAASGDKLKFDGTEWRPQADELSAINDVDLSTAPSANQVLTWDDVNAVWKADDPQSTVDVLNDLSDVDAASPNTNEVLTWDGSHWISMETQSTISNINDLDDVDTISTPPTDAQALIWNDASGKWVPGDVQGGGGGGGATYINDLLDVDTATNPPNIDQTLKWNGSNWVPGTFSSGGASELDDLSDVDVSSTPPTNDQVLMYNGSVWVPGTVSGGTEIEVVQTADYYVHTSGDDTTGDGSQASPFRTITRAIEESNKIISTQGVRILCESGASFDVPDSITIWGLNRIIIDTDGTLSSKVTITTTSEDRFSLFILEANAFLYFGSYVRIDSNKFTLFEYKGPNAFVYLNSNYINVFDLVKINEQIAKDSAKIKMYNCHIYVETGMQFRHMSVTGMYNKFHTSQDTNNPIAYFYNCNLDNFEVTLYPYDSDNRLIKFSECTSCKLNVNVYAYGSSVDNTTTSAMYSPIYFNNCMIANLILNCGKQYLAPVGFSGCLINYVDYVNNTYLIEDDGEDCGSTAMECSFIIADEFTTINNLYMTRDNDDSSFVSVAGGGSMSDKEANTKIGEATEVFMIYAYDSSVINVRQVNQYGECFTTYPSYVQEGSTMYTGSRIYIMAIENDPNPSESSGGGGSKLTLNDDEE